MGTLRFLLALCVVVGHSPGSTLFGYTLLSGLTAVQGFYVLSGFLITMVINERAEYRDRISNFYISRYLRLWPAYAAVAVLTLMIGRWDSWIASIGHFDAAAGAFIAFSNAMIFFQDLFLFFAVTGDGTWLYPTAHFGTEPGMQLNSLLLIPQAWSLGVELSFYLIAPYFCRTPTRMGMLFAIGVLTRMAIGVWSPNPPDPWLYRFSPAEMAVFSLGGLAYFGGRWLQRRLLAPWNLALGYAAVLAFVAIVFALHPYLTGYFSRRFFLLNPIIILTIAGCAPFLLNVSRRSPLDSMIGELSYPMYLCHMLVGAMVAKLFPGGALYGNVPYVAATVMFSPVLLWLVIQPADGLRRRFGARPQGLPTDQRQRIGRAEQRPHVRDRLVDSKDAITETHS